MGITGDRQDGAIRFSFGAGNTEEEADTAAQMIEEQPLPASTGSAGDKAHSKV